MSTETQIKAGRELDALIATEVMGWTHDRERAHQVSSADGEGWEWVTGWRRGNEEWLHEFPPAYYSTTYEGMGLVLDQMRERGWAVAMDRPLSAPLWVVVFWREIGGSYGKDAPSLPHAVALAALAAVRA